MCSKRRTEQINHFPLLHTQHLDVEIACEQLIPLYGLILVTGRSDLNRNQARCFIFIIVALRLNSKVTEINSASTFKVCFHN